MKNALPRIIYKIVNRYAIFIPFVFFTTIYISFFATMKILVVAMHLCRDVATPLLVTRGSPDLPPVTKDPVEAVKKTVHPDRCLVAELDGAGHLYNGHEAILVGVLTDWRIL